MQPRVALFQIGCRNHFGHPAAEVLDRYRGRGIASPACGAWQWRADGSADASCERDAARRYWQRRIDAPSP